jgi:GDP-L-fucose synthase
MSKKILITGSNGMLGKSICKSSKFKNYKLIKTYRKSIDLRNIKNFEKLIKKTRPDIVIHCAAKVGGIKDNINNPLDYLNDNFIINYNVINTCYKFKIKNLINIASSCIYPKNFNKKLKETNLLDGKLEETNEGYALSKIFGLKLCKLISDIKGYNYISVIPCNLFGPYDKFDINRAHLLPSIIQKSLDAKKNNKKNILMWGNGLVRREFLYIDDLVDFLYICTQNLNKVPRIINVGYGKDFTVKNFYQMVINIIDKDIKIKKKLNMPVGQKFKLLDISLAKKLGWKPKTRIKDGIYNTIKYLEMNTI